MTICRSSLELKLDTSICSLVALATAEIIYRTLTLYKTCDGNTTIDIRVEGLELTLFTRRLCDAPRTQTTYHI